MGEYLAECPNCRRKAKPPYVTIEIFKCEDCGKLACDECGVLNTMESRCTRCKNEHDRQERLRASGGRDG